MKKSILLAGGMFAIFLSACNNDRKEQDMTDSVATTHPDTAIIVNPPTGNPAAQQGTECYSYTNNRDTVSMKLNISGEEYTGTLKYNYFEKDKSSGTFAGEMNGDTLIAEYIFDAEGMRSVREVVFLRRNGTMVEGYGDIEQKNGKVMLKDESKLDFAHSVTLRQVPCKD